MAGRGSAGPGCDSVPVARRLPRWRHRWGFKDLVFTPIARVRWWTKWQGNRCCHSGLIRSFPCDSSDPLTDLSIDTSLCWEGCKQKMTNHGEFGLGNLHIVKSPRLSRYFKLQTVDNYPALEMIRCLEILKLPQRGSFPWSQFAFYFAHFSDDFPSNIQPNVCVRFTRWRLVHWNLRGQGIGKGEQIWYETLKPMEFFRVQAIKMDENGNGYLYILYHPYHGSLLSNLEFLNFSIVFIVA